MDVEIMNHCARKKLKNEKIFEKMLFLDGNIILQTRDFNKKLFSIKKAYY